MSQKAKQAVIATLHEDDTLTQEGLTRKVARALGDNRPAAEAAIAALVADGTIVVTPAGEYERTDGSAKGEIQQTSERVTLAE